MCRFEKIIGMLLVIAGLCLLIKGIIEGWWGHIIFGFIGMGVGIIIVMNAICKTTPSYDEYNNRLYRFVSENENPHHARCPKCQTWSPMIVTINEKYHYGVYCPYHYEVWFDLYQRGKRKGAK